jgi:bifunctional non-homologous end joining protein LigD
MGLPYFIPPMLAVHGSPFDSTDYIFELKWDGFRAIVLRDVDDYRLMSRYSIDLAAEFPELGILGSLPAGTVLDGEITALVDGKADFESLRASRTGRGVRIAYFVFDVLYEKFEPVISLPLMERKEILRTLLSPYVGENLVLNTFVDTYGKIFFEKVRLLGLEGIIAKQKQSLYIPGKRENIWKKIKNPSEIMCVVIGFIPKEESFKSLILAAEIMGKLKYVGKVGTGFSRTMKETLMQILKKLSTVNPVVTCPEPGTWIKPGLYCKISYTEFTHDGRLRAPVFKSIVE